MNTSLRRVTMTLMALIVLLLGNATLTQVFAADGLRADPRNQRVLLDEYSRQRGQITAAGQLLAYSVPTDGRIKYQRIYPDPAVYAPVTGFYSLRYSSSGLERAEDTARLLDAHLYLTVEDPIADPDAAARLLLSVMGVPPGREGSAASTGMRPAQARNRAR